METQQVLLPRSNLMQQHTFAPFHGVVIGCGNRETSSYNWTASRMKTDMELNTNVMDGIVTCHERLSYSHPYE